ncbi:hypothetical protein [Sphingomonas sp. dw_22]|uniref:hypothetical protein n=1 Tax=Sphingomonas sp. dw_22 TaxID=2721175 RepID=UPI001BD3BB97|nr:hypothetical protein [Sphingomonas sp. dw_22]
MSQPKLAILGGGGFAREVAEVARLCGFTISACYAIDPGTFAPIHRGYLDELAADAKEIDGVVFGIGATDRRTLKRRMGLVTWLRDLGIACPPLVSPRAVISEHVSVGDGAFVAHGVVLSVGAKLSPFCVVNSGAIIGHDVHVAENAIIAPGAFLGGGASIGESTLIGPLTKVLQEVAIGSDVILGVGCTALRSLPDGATVWPRPDRTT